MLAVGLRKDCQQYTPELTIQDVHAYTVAIAALEIVIPSDSVLKTYN